MNGSVFWRLVWKEYRMQRAIWISMAALTVLVQLAILAFVREGVDRVTWLFAIGLGLPAFYALGCGATLFATEHEAETYEFQRALPVSAIRLFGGKFAFAVISISAMIGLLWPLSAILAGWQLPGGEKHLELWGLWGLGAVELLLWGMFFSLLCTRPLLAAILAVTAASVIVHVAAGGPEPYMGGEQPYLAAVPLRAAIAGLVVLADLWLGYRWFRERVVVSGGGVPSRREIAREETADEPGVVPPLRSAVFGRLVWQQWRQSARMIAALSAMVVPVVLFFAWYAIRQWIDPEGRHLSQPRGSDPFLMALALAVAPLMGACVFLADKRRQSFRFLAERGVRPTQVWLSRHLIWAAAMLCLTAVAAVFFIVVVVTNTHVRAEPGEVFVGLGLPLGLLLGFVVLAYASGQLWSMFLRSGILAGFFSLLLTGALCGWAWLTWFLSVPWIWSVAPIPLVFLLATWLRAPDWLLERNRFRVWVRPGLVLLVAATGLPTAVSLYRVYEVPAVDPGFSPEQYAQPASAEQRATADMYRRALDLYVPMKQSAPAEDKDVEASEVESEVRTARRAAWLKANEEALALTLKASRRAACDCYDPAGTGHLSGIGWDLAWLTVRSAEQIESEGKLDAALQRYLAALRVSLHMRPRTRWPYGADHVEKGVYDRLISWAARPDQTAERIATANDQLGKLTEDLPSRSDAIKSEYLRMRRIISADPYALANELDLSRPDEFWAALALQWLPWERARALRVLNFFTARDLTSFHHVESAILEGTEFEFPDYPRDDQQWLALGSSTPSLGALYWPKRCGQARELARMETRRRAVRLLLALQAWKIEHGKLPKTLGELVGPYLDHLPVDPYSAEPFRYFPDGVPIPLNLDPRAVEPEILEAGTPFIWSAGPEVVALHRDEKPPDRYGIYIGGGEWRRPTSEQEVWQSGWVFPLP